MQADTLLVVLGDSPRMPTGLGRIAGDLAAHLHGASARLGIDVVQVGWEYGTPALQAAPWPLVTFPDIREDWGASQVVALVEQERLRRGYAANQVVLLSVWDPARCFFYRDVPWQTWGYFAIDGHNRNGSFGGPAAEAVRQYDRVLGYTAYGAEVLGKVLNPVLPGPVQYLPHGHHWGEEARQQAQGNAQPPAQGWRLGCVSSNTPRKDLGLFFATLRWLRDAGERVYGWLHVDDLVTGAWSVPELMDVYGIERDWVEITEPPMSDEELQARYVACAVVLAVGRGEGFCYPIVEALAMGRCAVHVDYAGGAELTPVEGRVIWQWFDETNPYCVQRPVLNVDRVAKWCRERAHAALEDPTLAAHYAGSVAHLQWQNLWPRWETWVRQGLKDLRARR